MAEAPLEAPLPAKAAALAMAAAGLTPETARTVAATLVGVGAATACGACCAALCRAPPPVRERRTPARSAPQLKGGNPGGSPERRLEEKIEQLEKQLSATTAAASEGSTSSRRALNVETAETLGLMRGTLEQGAEVLAVAAVPALQQLAAGLADGSIQVWEAGSCTRVHAVRAKPRAGGVVALAHEPALQLTASACEDGTVQLWSARWEELGSVAPPRPDLTPTALAVLPPHAGSAHGSVAVGYDDGGISVWALSAAASTAQSEAAAANPSRCIEHATQALHRGRVDATAPGSAGRDVASLGREVENLRSSVDALLDAADQLVPLIGIAAGVTANSEKRGSKHSRSRTDEGSAVPCVGEPSTLLGHDEVVASLRWVPALGAMLSGSFDTTIRVWVPQHATRPPRSLGPADRGMDGEAPAVAWECTQSIGADVNDEFQSVRAVGAVVLGSQYAAVAEGSLLVSGHGDGRLKLWRAGRGAAAADQGRVIGGSEGHAAEDTTVRCPTVSARSYLTGGGVQDVAVSSVVGIGAEQVSGVDRYVASASEDGTVHLWKAESLVGTAASSGTASRVKPITTLQRGLASMDTDTPPPPVQALALVRVGTVPLLAVAAGNAVDLWQIA